MIEQPVIELKFRDDLIKRYFDEDLLRVLENYEAPFYETMDTDRFHMLDTHYRAVSYFLNLIDPDNHVTNEFCFVVQLLRIQSVKKGETPSAVEESKKVLKELSKALKMYELLDSNDHEISEINIQFKSKTSTHKVGEKNRYMLSLKTLQAKLRNNIKKEIQILRDLEKYHTDRLILSEYVNKPYKLTPSIFNFIRNNSNLGKKNIYSMIGIFYHLSSAEELSERDFLDVIKKRVERS